METHSDLTTLVLSQLEAYDEQKYLQQTIPNTTCDKNDVSQYGLS